MAGEQVPSLEFKPDFAEARQRWLAFWEQEIIDRPCCVIRAPKEGAPRVPGPRYMEGHRGEFDEVVQRALAWGETIFWGGEAIPSYTPSFGPDQFAAWMGANLLFPDNDFGTSWAVPCIEEWDAALPIYLRQEGHWWRGMLLFMEALADGLAGKMIVTHLDLHSNLDALLAMRGGERLCMDLMDVPETIDRAMADVRAQYEPVYQALYNAARMGDAGTAGWVPAYHPERTNTIQCDFAALIGPEHFRRWALPALEEEAAFLGHCVYHYDGPECLVHLPDICSIPHLDCVQWTRGARNKAFVEWMPLLKEIQARGKSVWLECNPETLKVLHKELKPNMLFYDCWASTQKEAEETLEWLKRNT